MSDENAYQHYIQIKGATERAEAAGYEVEWSETGWVASKDGRHYRGRTAAELTQVVAVQEAESAEDDDIDGIVYVITYEDRTGGSGIGAVMRSRSKAINSAWESARKARQRWAENEGYPRQVEHYGEEIIRIEYGGEENWMAVERWEVE